MPDMEHDTLIKPKVKKPSMYKVVILNDDFTPFEFVIEVLCSIFHKSAEDAISITKQIHQNGVGIGGVYTHEVAETKAMETMQSAKVYSFPLRCTIEKE